MYAEEQHVAEAPSLDIFSANITGPTLLKNVSAYVSHYFTR